jgi:hypothetical protein
MVFVGAGGTIVLLDGYYAGNEGTSLIANATGLLAIEPRYGATGISCDVLAPSDPLVAGLPSGYVCPRNSVRLTLSESGANVTTVVTAGNPVVIDKVY